ncbi:non-ribosomal peptide synthase [Hapalosiphon sp. MRB220]|nr:non-ribosomal peptide synthase [Hapalosiphon sp. MRB220]
MGSEKIAESLDGIAIIGMAGRFPGANNIEEFWQNLRLGVESISVFTTEELIRAGIDPAIINDANHVKAGGVLENIDLFDAGFFDFTPKEAEITDPQHRLFLECANEALENAGYDSTRCKSRIGIYAGASFNNYLSFNLNRDHVGSAKCYQTLIGNDKDFLTTRVSYKLHLTGPSITIQTACSTSLVATNLACQSLLSYQCDMALAGGVSIHTPQKTGYLHEPGGTLSADGRCYAFDARAQGTTIGNGLGVVVLKRLEDAIVDGDNIHAVIKGSAVNNDGAMKVGYTAPSVDGQAEAIAEAIMLAGIEPETITYVEAHGTGTTLGDPIEISALTKAFRTSTDKKTFCAIGSVKTNIGHLDVAAGITGLIKTVLALKHKQIPPSLNFEQPNPQIDFANSPFYVNTKLTEWKAEKFPRRAGVSSLGIGGTNAHVILEESATLPDSTPSRAWQLLLLSAKTESALETVTDNLVQHLTQYPQQNLADVAHTLQMGRREFNHRRILVCQDIQDAVRTLHDQNSQRIFTHYQEPCSGLLTFMFPGQGAQYVQMGKEVYETEPTFREQIDHCCLILKPHLGLDLRSVIYPQESETQAAAEQLNQTQFAQSALFVIEYALAQLWISWGISPEAMIGNSIGEYVAACIAGVMNLEDALNLVAMRGRFMQQLPSGSMLSIPLPEAEVKTLLSENLSLAASNAPSACVVSGNHVAIDALYEQLIAQDILCRRLHTSHAFHSQMMAPILEPFMQEVRKVKLNSPQIPFISNVTGTWITAAEATDARYWAKHLRQTVYFSAGITQLLQEPNRILLEVGPGRTLRTLVKQHSSLLTDQVVLSSLRHPQEEQPDTAFLLNTLGQLWLAGVNINWSNFYAHERRHRVPLPTYPFERQRYWIETEETVSNPKLINREQTELPSLHSRPNLNNTYVAPKNELEQTLVNIWQEVFGIEQIGIYDNFFELGGDSLLSIQITTKANKAGLRITNQHLFEYPAIAQLAEVVAKMQTVVSEQGLLEGTLPLTPIQHWFFAQNLVEQHHWNQAILLEAQQPLKPAIVQEVVQHLLVHHDALRLRFVPEESSWQQFCDHPDTLLPFKQVDLSQLSFESQESAFTEAVDNLQASLNISSGPLIQVALFDLGSEKPQRLLLIIHHLAVDISSWRILLEDLETVYHQIDQGKTIQLPLKTTSLKQWSQRLIKYAQSQELQAEQAYWLSDFRKKVSLLPVDYSQGANTVASARTISVKLSVEDTKLLLQQVLTAYRVQVDVVLLTALTQTFAQWTGTQSLLIDLEGNGREVIFDDVDLSRTVGWFTTIAPALLELGVENISEPGKTLKLIKKHLRSFPEQGLGYGVLSYLDHAPAIREQLQSLQPAEVIFLYLGKLEQTLPQSSLFKLSPKSNGSPRSLHGKRSHLLEVNGSLIQDQLVVDWIYSENVHRRETIEKLANNFLTALQAIITDCQSSSVANYTPSDFAEFKSSQWDQTDLDNILAALNQSALN